MIITAAAVATMTSSRGSWLIVITSAFIFFSVEPVEVLGVLDRNVGVLHDDHKDVLHDRHQEEDEKVHEELSVPKVGLFHRMIGIE